MNDVTLPAGWCSARVADLARPDEQPVLTGPFGTSLGREDFIHKGIPVLTIGCLTDTGISTRKANFVSSDKAEGLDRYKLRQGDMLFSRMASVGRASIVPKELDGSLFNYHIMRLRLAESAYRPELFIYYIRGSSAVQNYLNEVNHGATRDGINTAQLLEMPVLVPPHSEQRRIVAKLDTLTAKSRRAKEALDAIPALLERFRQSVLAAAFRGDLTADWREKNPDVEPAEELLKRIRAERRRRWEEAELAKMRAKGKVPGDDRWKERYEEPAPVDASELPELPEGWTWASLDEVRAFDAPIVYGIILPGDDFPGGIPYVRPIDVTNDGDIDFTSVKRTSPAIAEQYARSRLKDGDIILSIVGTIGKVSITPEALDGGNITQSSVRIRPPEWSSPEYMRWVLLSPQLRRQYDKFRFGNAVQRLNVEHVRNLAVPLVPPQEQEFLRLRIETALRRVPSTAVRVAAERLFDLDRALLQRAFRGELVPQDPNDEPASALLERLRAEATSNSQPNNDARRPRKPAPSGSSKPSTTGRGRKPSTSARSPR